MVIDHLLGACEARSEGRRERGERMRRVARRGSRRTSLVISSGVAGALALAAIAPSALAGAATSTEARGNPAVVGRWSRAFNPGSNAVGISATLLHNGKVLIMGDELSGRPR